MPLKKSKSRITLRQALSLSSRISSRKTNHLHSIVPSLYTLTTPSQPTNVSLMESTLSTHDMSQNVTVHSTKSLNVSIVINMDIKQPNAKVKHNVESVEIGTPYRIAKQ